jgi:hypothetical protein
MRRVEGQREHFGNICRLYEGVQGAFFLRKKHLAVCFRPTAIPKIL